MAYFPCSFEMYSIFITLEYCSISSCSPCPENGLGVALAGARVFFLSIYIPGGFVDGEKIEWEQKNTSDRFEGVNVTKRTSHSDRSECSDYPAIQAKLGRTAHKVASRCPTVEF